MTDDGKSIKPYNSDVCPQNITQLLRISYLGKAGFTSLIEKDVNNSRYDDIQKSLSDDQKSMNKKNQEFFAMTKYMLYGLALFAASWMFFPSLYQLIHSIMTGEIHDNENGTKARYNIWISLSAIIVGVLCFIPGFFGNESEEGNEDAFSFYDFFQNFTFMSDATFTSQFISTYFYRLYTGGLETSNPDQTEEQKKKEMEKSNVYYSVRATIGGIINTSVVISASSAFNNEIENKKDKSTNWKVRLTTDDVWQPNDNYGIDFEHRFAEDPNQTMWKADPITFAANPESLGNTLAYLKAINYNKSYRSFDDIDGLAAQAEKLKTDIKTTSFYNDEAGFTQIANDATEIFYRDAQANIMKIRFKDWMKKSDEIALLKINYACSKDKSSRFSSQRFIDAHTGKSNDDSGIADCVTADWKLMGQNTPEFYAEQIKEKTEALQKEYYDVRIKINNQYRESHTNTELQSKALDNYVDDAWAVEHGYASRAFNLSKYIRDVSLNVTDQGSPTLKDSQAIMQKQYENDYNASLQNTDLESATIMGFVSPQIELDKCNNTSIHPVTCLQQYGQKISETMADLIIMGVAIKAMSLAATEFGDNKKAKLKKKIADEDETAGISKKQSIAKQNKVKSNNFQLVGALMSGLSSFMLWVAGFGYAFAMVMKFLMAFSMIGPFVIMYTLYIVYSLLLILSSFFALFAFSRYNDKNNLAHLAKTIWSLFLSTFIMGTVIVIAYTLNWELTASFDRIIIAVISYGVAAEYSDSASLIINSITTMFVYYIGFMAIGFTSLGYSITAIEAISKALGISAPYISYGNQFTNKAKLICFTFSFGILWVIELGTKFLGEKFAERMKNKYRKRTR
ncbi:ABC transporter permease [Pseudomonas ficuserectae]|uniref:ABC transporter permease n=1 Tax=Pseudomonas ficuserectae TaxID=53410 RepID=UPI0011C387A4|nr:ABC transporter permease [Pseudomonas ficuserectae]